MGTYEIDLPKILEAGRVALEPFAAKVMAQPESFRLLVSDLEWEAWGQTWGSTALGYGGIGGCAMTHAQTVIVTAQSLITEVAVFFGCPRLAYIANQREDWWAEAYERRQMPMKGEKFKSRRKGT